MLKSTEKEYMTYLIVKIDDYIHMDIKELQEEILSGNMQFSGVIHYDEEFLWIKHQPYVRLTILDAENKLIIEDTVIPRDIFTFITLTVCSMIITIFISFYHIY